MERSGITSRFDREGGGAGGPEFFSIYAGISEINITIDIGEKQCEIRIQLPKISNIIIQKVLF